MTSDQSCQPAKKQIFKLKLANHQQHLFALFWKPSVESFFLHNSFHLSGETNREFVNLSAFFPKKKINFMRGFFPTRAVKIPKIFCFPFFSVQSESFLARKSPWKVTRPRAEKCNHSWRVSTSSVPFSKTKIRLNTWKAGLRHLKVWFLFKMKPFEKISSLLRFYVEMCIFWVFGNPISFMLAGPLEFCSCIWYSSTKVKNFSGSDFLMMSRDVVSCCCCSLS